MIRANEIRKDNWINSKLLGSNHKVKGFINEMLYTDLQRSYSEFEDWQGIPLTPEILEKSGIKDFKLTSSASIHKNLYRDGTGNYGSVKN